MNRIILSEKPHFVIQGEGVHTNKKMILLRVFGCPLRCINCDSQQTWTEKNKEYSIKEFYKMIKILTKEYNTDHILLTGGEPGLYISFMKEFFETYQDDNEWLWDIETAGVHSWEALYKWNDYIQFNFSPKIGALVAGNDMELKAFDKLPYNFIIKVVTSKKTFEEDLRDILRFQAGFKINNKYIYLMPKGIDTPTIIEESKWLIEKIGELPYNFSTRQHILLYGNKKLV